MEHKANTITRKIACVALSFVLAISMATPVAYAQDEQSSKSTSGSKSDTSSIGQSDDAADGSQNIYAPSPDEANINSVAEEGDGSDGQIDEPAPAEPEPVPEPDPVPEQPQTVTFKFNISKSPVIQDIEQVTSGLRVTWSRVTGVTGYIVLRRAEGAGLAVDEKYEAGISGNSITLDPSLFKLSALQKVGWASYANITNPNTISWVDKNASYGKLYEYTVMAYTTNASTSNATAGLPYIPSYAKNRDLSKPAASEIGYRMATPTLKTVSRKTKSITVKWGTVKGATGYTIQVSKNSAFTSKKTKTVKGASATSATITGLTKGAKYCVRIRAYGNVYQGTTYSMWNTCSFTKSTKRASMARLTYTYKVKKPVTKTTSTSKVKAASTSNVAASKTAKKKVTYVTKKAVFELRSRAGQKMGRYDTMQGGCSDGTYMYLCLLSKSKKRCKIAKVNIKTRKVIKLSAPLKLGHGNGLAYNSSTKRVVVAHGEGGRKILTEINAKTLKKVRSKTVNAPATLKGATAAQVKAYAGFGSIAYSASQGVYLGLLYKSHNVVVMDNNFNMIQYITLSKKKGQVYQCIETIGDNILIGESFGTTYAKRYNILSTYNWDGQYVTTTRLQRSFELEHVFVAGTRVYAGFYRSYVKGRKFMKDNYIYRVNTF